MQKKSSFVFKPCPVCMVVSSLWLFGSLFSVLGYLHIATWQLPIAILMGTSVMGIAGQGEKRFAWSATHPMVWKSLVLLVGVPLVYLAVTHLSIPVVLAEFIFMFLLALLMFRETISFVAEESGDIEAIKARLKNCC